MNDDDPNIPDDEVDIEALDAEVAAEAEAEVEPEVEAVPVDKFWSVLSEGIGDAPDAPNRALLDQMTPDTLAKLAPEARGIIKQVQSYAEQRVAAAKAEIQAERDAVAAEKAALEEARRQQVRQQSQMSAFMNDPKVKAVMAIAAEDVSTVDAFTPEGARKIAQHAGAKAATDALGPMFEAAAKQQKQLEWDDFVVAKPLLRDKSFYEPFAAKVKAGKDWETAHNEVLAARYESDQKARAERERAARAESIRKVRRDATGGDPARTPSAPPPEIVKQGGAAVAAWHRAHPKAARRA